MKKYAYVADGVVQYLLSTGGDITEMFHPDMTWVDLTGVKPVPSEGWAATAVGETWEFSAPVQDGGTGQ